MGDTDLERLLEEYAEIKNEIRLFKLAIDTRLDNLVRRLDDFITRKLIEYVEIVPFDKLIKQASNAGILEELLSTLPKDTVLSKLKTLDVDSLVFLYNKTWLFRDEVLEEFINRVRTAQCDVLERCIRELNTVSMARHHVMKLFENLVVRFDCPRIVDGAFNILYIHRLYTDDIIYNAIERVVGLAIKNYSSQPCSVHLSLLHVLGRTHHYTWFADTRGKIDGILRKYAEVILENMDSCSIQDIAQDMIEAEKPLHVYLADKQRYAKAVVKVLARDIEKVRPATIAGVINSLCELGKEICCTTLKKVDFSDLTNLARKAFETLLKTQVEDISEVIGDLAIAISVTRVAENCPRSIPPDKTGPRELCGDIDGVIKFIVNRVENPSSTLELVNSLYWLYKLKTEFVIKWCGFTLEVPDIVQDRVLEVIRKDLEKGIDVIKMRNEIAKLTEVDQNLSKRLMRLFDKQRRKLGILLRRKWI